MTANADKTTTDTITYSPFLLENCLATEYKDMRLAFSQWDWLREKYGTDTVNGYYMNGYGIQGLVQAAMYSAQLDVDDEAIDFNSEGDTCYIHFKNMDTAVRVAELASAMINTPEILMKMIEVARKHGFED